MRKLIAAGNWKMHLTGQEAQQLANEIINMHRDEYQGSAEVIFAVPAPYLALVAQLTSREEGVHLAAQNLHQEEQGAYTGEVSATMLDSVGASHCLVGHSERRQIFGEDNALLASKLDRALAHDITPIYCIGETLEERESGATLEVIEQQMNEGTYHLMASDFVKLIIAYEPVWAIGTGKTASPEQAQEVHAFIRSLIADQYSPSLADEISILYGGSVKPGNAAELFGKADIDGGLVGGASLKSGDFNEIIKALP